MNSGPTPCAERPASVLDCRWYPRGEVSVTCRRFHRACVSGVCQYAEKADPTLWGAS